MLVHVPRGTVHGFHYGAGGGDSLLANSGDADPVIDCTIVDYSAGGACLDVGFVNLPQRFELLWGTTKKKCRVVWKAGRRFGVVF